MGTSGGESGGIQQITAADTTIVVGGSQAATTVKANVGTAAGTVAAGDDGRFGKIGNVNVTGTPAAGQMPVATGPTAAAWSTPAGGGDVIGPGASVNGHLAVFDGTTGKLIKDGGPLPTGDVAGPGSAIDSHVALFDGVTGKLLKDGGSLPAAGSTTPAALGTAAAGSGTAYARDDHVHPMPSAADVGAIAPATGIVVVNHGANASETRPAGAAVVYWIGTVAPTNAVAHDFGDGW